MGLAVWSAKQEPAYSKAFQSRMPPRIGLPATFFLCVFDAVFEKRFLDFLFGIALRFFMFCPPDRFLDTFGVMGHIDTKEYNMPRPLVKRLLVYRLQEAL